MMEWESTAKLKPLFQARACHSRDLKECRSGYGPNVRDNGSKVKWLDQRDKKRDKDEKKLLCIVMLYREELSGTASSKARSEMRRE
jgi:hypothetical protein